MIYYLTGVVFAVFSLATGSLYALAIGLAAIFMGMMSE
jgi:uncharacterized membrane protein